MDPNFDCVRYGGWAFPKYEAHLPGWMKRVQDWRKDHAGKFDEDKRGRLLYQGKKYRHALRWVGQRRNAIDVGGHIGLWAWQMALDFGHVWSFEPMPVHRACYDFNMRNLRNWTLYPLAVGAENKMVHIRTRTKNSSGDTGVDVTGRGLEVQQVVLDEFDFRDVDFVKIDCEGYEVFVLEGMKETLRRCKPCVIVEQKPETGGAAHYGIGVKDGVKLLESLGAKQRLELAGDHIMSWDA